jgi:hypothetical protein
MSLPGHAGSCPIHGRFWQWNANNSGHDMQAAILSTRK